MRPVTLFTGQWADLPLEELLVMVSEMGFDGVELACWGDHFEVEKAVGMTLAEYIDGLDVDETAGQVYRQAKWKLLDDLSLNCFAISAHLVGQATCDMITPRHQAILPPAVWGEGVSVFPGEIGYEAEEAEQIRKRAASMMEMTAIAARLFMNDKPDSLKAESDWGVEEAVVNGFTGSPIWAYTYSFPPVSQAVYQAGYAKMAERWIPILDVFHEEGVRFALEVHPTEIAFDIESANRTLEALEHREEFGFNFDPSHLIWQGVDPADFIEAFPDRIYHVHMKDAEVTTKGVTSGLIGGTSEFGATGRAWDFRSIGRGGVNFTSIIRALNKAGYNGPLSVEWEDPDMDREHGAAESCKYVKGVDFPTSQIAFDGQFEQASKA